MNSRPAALVHPGSAMASGMCDSFQPRCQEVLGEARSCPKSISEPFYETGARN